MAALDVQAAYGALSFLWLPLPSQLPLTLYYFVAAFTTETVFDTLFFVAAYSARAAFDALSFLWLPLAPDLPLVLFIFCGCLLAPEL